MKFKEIQERDLEKLVGIYIDAFNREPWNDKWTEKTATDRLRNMMKDSGFYGLSIEEDEVYSFILGHDEIFYDGVMFNIKEFCTNRKHQGRGYGEKLLLELEKKLKERGIREIILMTTKSEKAEGFYKRRDYENYDELVMMGKKLKR